MLRESPSSFALPRFSRITRPTLVALCVGSVFVAPARAPSSALAYHAPLPMTGGRPILVVDDDTDLRETLGELLEDEGYDAHLCENGRVALDRLRQGERPALILLDLMMPEMNGWQFREEQLRDERFAGIPVIVMTASRGFEGHPITASEILYKPVGLGDLIEAVERNAR